MANTRDVFGARSTLDTAKGPVNIYRLRRLDEEGVANIDKLPFTIRILLENVLRHSGGKASPDDVKALGSWRPGAEPDRDIPFMPGRVVLQDFTGVPSVVDLAAMRSAMARMGGDPSLINPVVPSDLVIDHSVQVDTFGTQYAFFYNVEKEFERNRERYALLRWAQQAFHNFRVVPPGTGIVHQVNLEYLASVVASRDEEGGAVAFPDTLVGTDSHTTMINGLGVLGWGVGGIEAEAVMLGEPYFMLIPQVVGFRLTGELPAGATATDLVLTVTQILRNHGVVGKFVEFFGEGLSALSLPDRATIANMSPEYGATVGFFPVDQETLRYMRITGRDEETIDLVERYCKEQGLFRTADTPDPEYSEVLEFDLSNVEPSLAGPRRPQDRVNLSEVKKSFLPVLEDYGRPLPEAYQDNGNAGGGTAVMAPPKTRRELSDGSVVIAAITSCTNTSNPSVMVGAALLAKRAVERGLRPAPYVKTSLAPGSAVVTDYLQAAGLLPYLEALGFHVVGYGCTTCIGNSGTLLPPIAQRIEEEGLVVASVLSGNRNFEGRINPLVKANYLASPPLVIAYALAGRIDVDLTKDPVGYDPNGQPVYLHEIWPSSEEIQETIANAIRPELFTERYAKVFEGDERWQTLPVPDGDQYEWDPASTYVQEPPFFFDLSPTPEDPQDIEGARVLALLGDSITTDHISPAGAIAKENPAGRYLLERGVAVEDFNTYGSRRGNHEVMMRGTFGNIRLRNQLVPGVEGGRTKHLPSGEEMWIYDAAVRYKEEGVPLMVIAGKEYGSGSSRDWAAKGPQLQGVRAVLAESFERIHRSNLVGMGVLPLQFREGENAESLGLDGTEEYSIRGLSGGLEPRQEVTITAKKADGSTVEFKAISRLDTAVEVEYYRNGGILHTVLRKRLEESK